MSFYRDQDAFAEFHVMQRVLSMFDGNTNMQRIIQAGFVAQMEDSDDSDSDLEWYSRQNQYQMHRRTFTDKNSSNWSAAEYQAKESDAERKARLLLEIEKEKEKAEKKRLKKQRQKERKRLEKEQNSTQDNESKNITSDATVEDKKFNNRSKDKCLSGKDMATAQDSESNDTSDESSNEDNDAEGLDLTSSFVTKAAQIAKRQLEQNTKKENKEKKKTAVKEEPKTTREKPNDEENHIQKKDTATFSSKMEDNVKISTELAMIGNKFASSGDFNMAVKYFTDAIRYNPTEYRLFGNRAFCFEKMLEYEKSLNDAELSLSMCPGWVKGLFRKGRALSGLKRYGEAASTFKEVLKLDSSCAEAAQELMRVQITQLMGYGFTRDQSSNALIIHGTVDKALEVLSKLNKQPEMSRIAPVPTKQVANVTGVSPVLSAKATPPAPYLPPARDTSKILPENKPLVPVQNLQSQTKPDVPSKSQNMDQAPELFPVWVGNLSFSVTEGHITNLFNKAGMVYSIKHLPNKRCAFVNYTQQQYCEEAIRKFHGFDLMGSKLAVRYPDRIPAGMNISRSAHKAHEMQDENLRDNLYAVGGRPVQQNYRGPYKY